MKKFIVILAMSLMMFGCADWFGGGKSDKKSETKPGHDETMKFHIASCYNDNDYPSWGGDIIHKQLMSEITQNEYRQCDICKAEVEAGKRNEEDINTMLKSVWYGSYHMLMNNCDISLATREIVKSNLYQCQAGHFEEYEYIEPIEIDMSEYITNCDNGDYVDTPAEDMPKVLFDSYYVVRLEKCDNEKEEHSIIVQINEYDKLMNDCIVYRFIEEIFIKDKTECRVY